MMEGGKGREREKGKGKGRGERERERKRDRGMQRCKAHRHGSGALGCARWKTDGVGRDLSRKSGVRANANCFAACDPGRCC